MEAHKLSFPNLRSVCNPPMVRPASRHDHNICRGKQLRRAMARAGTSFGNLMDFAVENALKWEC